MTLEEAKLLLENAIKSLALNAIQNKHLLNYIEQLEQYVAYLESDKEEKDESEAK